MRNILKQIRAAIKTYGDNHWGFAARMPDDFGKLSLQGRFQIGESKFTPK